MLTTMETSFLLQTQLRPVPNADSASLGTPDPYAYLSSAPVCARALMAGFPGTTTSLCTLCGLSDIMYYARLAVLHILTRQAFRLFEPRFVQLDNAHFSPLRRGRGSPIMTEEPVRHLHALFNRRKALAVGARRLNAMIYRIRALRRVLGSSFCTSPRFTRQDSRDVDPWSFSVCEWAWCVSLILHSLRISCLSSFPLRA
ncbi:hypothetical protein B0H13DRAFT_317066 [Mycena leptocephala]|nr:hypothetical protein B0H13DRAFT_317066 [Mycena leptocephala]